MDAFPWGEERVEASRLMQAIQNDFETNQKKRRWVSRRWPETLSLDDEDWAEKFLSESLLRDTQDDSLSKIALLVQRSLQELGGSTSVYDASEHVVMLKNLSDTELTKSIPFTLKLLNTRTLHSLSFLVLGRSFKAKNRICLERKLKAEVLALLEQGGEPLAGFILKASSVIRNSKSEESFSSADLHQVPFSSQEAVEGALQQLDFIPLRSLHAMNDILSKRISMPITGRLSRLGDSKAVLANRIRKKIARHLRKRKDDSIPQPVQDASQIMNLSAKEDKGLDREAVNYIQHISPEVEILHARILSALSLIKNLNFNQLENIYTEILGYSEGNFKKKHPSYYMRAIQTILREVLYRCGSGHAPAPVQRAVEIIHEQTETNSFAEAAEMFQKEMEGNKVSDNSNRYSGKSKRKHLIEQHCEREKEALLNLSSYLQRICYEDATWHDKVGGHTAEISPENSRRMSQRQSSQRLTFSREAYPARSNILESKLGELTCEQSSGLLDEERPMLVDRGEGELAQESGCFEKELLWKEDFLDENIKGIADQGAAIAYIVIGRAMAEAFRRRGGYLPENTRKYLQNGLLNSKTDTVQKVGASEHLIGSFDEEALVLSVAENLQFISKRTLAKVKARLGNSSS